MTANSKGRALFVLPKDKLGGAERVCATLAQAAARSGDFSGVDLYVLSRPPSGSLDEIGATPGLSIIYSGAKREASGLAPLARFLRGRSYALAFSTHIHLNAYLCLLRRTGVLTTDRLVTREAAPVDAFGRNGLPGSFRMGLLLYGNQDLIICQTNRMADALRQQTRNRLTEKTQVLRNFVDLERIENQRAGPAPVLDLIPKDALRIVWCGHLREEKRPERAVQALAELHRRGMPRAHLLMIGGGPMRAIVEQEISRLGVQAAVTLCGFQANPIALMAQCEIGLLTSDLEGFPNVILEMIAAGVRTVVTTNCAGDLDDLPNVSVCDSTDPGALAQAIIAAHHHFPSPVRPERLMQQSVPRYYQSVRSA
jgi:glycosyltransferase involved in cell wall biosynthesis